MNKKAVSIPIVIFVISVLSLSLLSLGYFLVKQNDIGQVFYGADGIDKLYSSEQKLNFYLDNVFEDAVSLDSSFDSGEDFIENFRAELVRLKDKNNIYPLDELALVEFRIADSDVISNVEIEGRVIRFKLDLKIQKFVSQNNFVIRYNYVRNFEYIGPSSGGRFFEPPNL